MTELNPAQRAAAEFDIRAGLQPREVRPLLILAGAGSGKTNTLAHRVANLILHGADPGRILLMTFTRRAAAEMTRRAQRIVAEAQAAARGRAPAAEISWSGTFHSMANRLLRHYAAAISLDPSFTVLDRSDSADLLNLLRNDLGFAKQERRFPRKDTCLAIYSRVVNTQQPLEKILAAAFPWCAMWSDELRRLFAAYVGAKQKQNVLDYDDLLLYWSHLMSEPALAAQVGKRFDYILVDEYQDTNALQARILTGLRPDGTGVTVVGDDAQSIYSFRAATIRNILEFPATYTPPATVLTLERNYRSVQPILDACNAVMEQASTPFRKKLFSERTSQEKPVLVTAEDEPAEVHYVADRILEYREAGIPLQRQAVLFRTAHHSDQLEIELGRRNIPFVKYGGLKFLEAAHVKDLLAILRLAENPRDSVAAFRMFQLLPAVGPAIASRALAHLEAGAFEMAVLRTFRPPPSAAQDWPALCDLLIRLRTGSTPWPAELGLAREWYQPHLQRMYDTAAVRAMDLEQLETIAAGYPSRERFLTELTLDPPDGSGDEAGPPSLDEDFLILSTIHSAKGQEWDVVYILHAADGCIPSDMSTGDPEQIEEERRLLYVAMTRARDHLHIVHPHRFYVRQQHRHGRRFVMTPLTRFLPRQLLTRFTCTSCGRTPDKDGPAADAAGLRIDVSARLRDMWSAPPT